MQARKESFSPVNSQFFVKKVEGTQNPKDETKRSGLFDDPKPAGRKSNFQNESSLFPEMGSNMSSKIYGQYYRGKSRTPVKARPNDESSRR